MSNDGVAAAALGGRRQNRLLAASLGPGTVLGVGVAALLLLIGYPLIWLVIGAFGWPRGFTTDFFVRAFSLPSNIAALTNTIVLAVGVGISSIVLGVPLAWAAARSDLPFRRVLHVMVGLAYVLPPYLTSLAYIILLGPNAGYFNRLLAWAFELGQGPLNIFSAAGVIFVISLHVFAFPYFLTYGALRSVDGSLEESARILGASQWTVLRRITLPLAAPAITGGALLAAVNSMALFGPQAFLGLPAQIVYLPTRIYGAISSYPPRFPEASALSIVLVLLTIAGLSLQRRYLQRQSFVTIAGRGIRSQRMSLGWLKGPFMAFAAIVVFLSALAPLSVLVIASFSKVWTNPFGADNWTLANFVAALYDNQIAVRGIVNSFKLAIGAASIAVLIGLSIAYLDLRTSLWGRRLLDYLAILPLGLPGTVLAVALIQACLRPPFRLYGTIWILLVAYVARSIPLAVRSANAALRQVDVSLEEAARIGGASWLTGIRRILVPILGPNLLLAWLLVFIPVLSELSATVLLYTSGTETIAVAIFRINDMGQLEVVAALSVVLIAIILVATILMQWIAGRGRMAALGEMSPV